MNQPTSPAIAPTARAHDYRAYGLLLRSPLELPQLTPEGNGTRAEPDVVVEITPFDPAVAEGLPEQGIIRFDDQEAIFKSSQLGYFFVRGGEKIEFHAFAEAERSRATALITGTLLAAILHQRGYFVVHASVVDLEGDAVAFVGLSGAGKSSMAAACCEAGHPLVADDTAAVEYRGEEAFVLAGSPMLKIHPLSAEALQIPTELLVDMRSLEPEKRSLRAKNLTEQHAHRLKAVYLLEYGEEESFHVLSQRESLIKMVPHIFPTRWLLNDSGSQLGRLAQFIKRVPVIVYRRRRDLSLLADHVGHIMEHTKGL